MTLSPQSLKVLKLKSSFMTTQYCSIICVYNHNRDNNPTFLLTVTFLISPTSTFVHVIRKVFCFHDGNWTLYWLN